MTSCLSSLAESSSVAPRPGRLKGRQQQQPEGARVCEPDPHMVAQRLEGHAEVNGGDLGEVEEEGEGLQEPHGEQGRGSITVGSCVSRDYTMTMRRWKHIFHTPQENRTQNLHFQFEKHSGQKSSTM